MHAIVILSLLAILVLYLGLSDQTRNWVRPVAIAGLSICLVDLIYSWSHTSSYFNDMLRDSPFSISFSMVLIMSTFLIFLLSGGYFEKISEHTAEYHALMLFSLVGGVILVSFQNMTMLFLGIEILSVSVYILAGIKKRDLLSNEAALKYFLMGAFFTAVLLLGIAFVYGATASFSLTKIAQVTQAGTGKGILLYTGILLILLALSFKVAIAPFHFWTPDVYTGSPTLVTAFMSTVVKVAGFAAFFRLFENAFPAVGTVWDLSARVMIIITLLAANFAALRQTSLKRLLAWSSISQAGYMLMPLLVVAGLSKGRSYLADNAILIYSIAYCLASIAAFAVMIAAAESSGTEDISSLHGLGKRSPLMAFAMTVAMASMAGIPLTAGFFGKFYVFKAVLETNEVWVVVIGVLAAVVGIAYYFKVIGSMYFEAGSLPVAGKIGLKPAFSAVVLICTVLSLALGIFPALFASILN